MEIPWDKLGISAGVDDELKSLSGERNYSGLGFQPGYKGEQFFIRGKYTLMGETAEAKIFIVKSTDQGLPVYQFTVTGTSAELAKLVAGKAMDLVNE